MPNNKPDKPTIIISCILLVIVAILFYSCSHIEPDHNDGKCDICGKKATYSSKGKEEYCARAGAFLEELKAEYNYITRMWEQCGIKAANASDSQALIQLKKEYCDKKKCLYCRIGYEYLKRN